MKVPLHVVELILWSMWSAIEIDILQDHVQGQLMAVRQCVPSGLQLEKEMTQKVKFWRTSCA